MFNNSLLTFIIFFKNITNVVPTVNYIIRKFQNDTNPKKTYFQKYLKLTNKINHVQQLIENVFKQSSPEIIIC